MRGTASKIEEFDLLNLSKCFIHLVILQGIGLDKCGLIKLLFYACSWRSIRWWNWESSRELLLVRSLMLRKACCRLVIQNLLCFDSSFRLCSMFLWIYQSILLRKLKLNFYEETKLTLWLLLCASLVFQCIFPFEDPRWSQDYRFLQWQEVHYPKTTWVHRFTVCDRWISCMSLFALRPRESFNCLLILKLFNFL